MKHIEKVATLLCSAVVWPPLLKAAAERDIVQVGNTFFAVEEIHVGAGGAAVGSGDFNGDGHADVVIGDASEHDIVVLFGAGEGSLTVAGRFPAGSNPTDVAIADINSDDILDLVVANHETSYLTLLYGDGRGGFLPAPNSPLTVNVDPHPHAVRVADLDRDGNPDLIVDHRGRRGLLAVGGMGEGRFQLPGTVIGVGGDPYLGFDLGDLDGDGWFDLVTPNSTEVGVLLHSGGARFAFDAAPSLTEVSPFAVALGDINGDLHPDLIVASDGSVTDVQAFLGNGRGSFREAEEAAVRMAPGAKNIAVGDINGDEFEDALVSSWSGEVVIVFGGHETLLTVPLPLESVGNPWGLAVVDLNEDGKHDLIVADGVRRLAAVYLSHDQ